MWTSPVSFGLNLPHLHEGSTDFWRTGEIPNTSTKDEESFPRVEKPSAGFSF